MSADVGNARPAKLEMPQPTPRQPTLTYEKDNIPLGQAPQLRFVWSLWWSALEFAFEGLYNTLRLLRPTQKKGFCQNSRSK